MNRFRWLALATAVCSWPTGLRAQAADSVAPASGASLPEGPWHAALRAQSALRQGQPRPEDVLRAMDAELTLGRPDRARLLRARHRIADPALEQEALILEAAGAYASGLHGNAGDLY
ncbi:MAG: hypothetical protein HY560_04390, partial [Gemmatimonadetes bacterium]|nr:hypothetical protein [Gemmatimonadota bacterium]